jgi:hypothetical protein
MDRTTHYCGTWFHITLKGLTWCFTTWLLRDEKTVNILVLSSTAKWIDCSASLLARDVSLAESDLQRNSQTRILGKLLTSHLVRLIGSNHTELGQFGLYPNPARLRPDADVIVRIDLGQEFV